MHVSFASELCHSDLSLLYPYEEVKEMEREEPYDGFCIANQGLRR
jgi:hypothetical protein